MGVVILEKTEFGVYFNAQVEAEHTTLIENYLATPTLYYLDAKRNYSGEITSVVLVLSPLAN